MKAGADFEQRADAPAQDRRGRLVGSVMRERILSSVDLPAPLRPMMPTTSPGCTVEGDILERPESVRLGPPAGRSASGDWASRGATAPLEPFASEAKDVLDGFAHARGADGAEPVELREVLDFDDRFSMRHADSDRIHACARSSGKWRRRRTADSVISRRDGHEAGG